MGSLLQTTAGSGTWTCPAGVPKASFYCWSGGAGGGGGGLSGVNGVAGNGGPAGGFAYYIDFTTTPGTGYDWIVGAGGSGAAGGGAGTGYGTDGGLSQVLDGGAVPIVQAIGTDVSLNSPGENSAGQGGSFAGKGGTGGAGDNGVGDCAGGGGGGCASDGGTGTNGVPAFPQGTFGTGGAGATSSIGKPGGDGGDGGAPGLDGSPGGAPGAGGGGGGSDGVSTFGNGGAGADGQLYIVWVDPPVADFSGTPTSGIDPLSVTFTDASTGTPTSWLWEKNDGSGWTTFSTSQNPVASFSQGTWSIRLTATNDGGSFDTKTITDYIVVSAPEGGSFPLGHRPPVCTVQTIFKRP